MTEAGIVFFVSSNKVFSIRGSNLNSNKISRLSFILCQEPSLPRIALYDFFQNRLGLRGVGLCDSFEQTLIILDQETPDLVISYQNLGANNPSGLELCRQITKREKPSKVLLIVDPLDHQSIDTAAQAGVSGVLSNKASPEELLSALEMISRGLSYPEDLFLKTSISNRERPSPHLDPLEDLSQRERQVFFLLGKGCSVEEVAKRLYITQKTVMSHRTSIKDKLGLKNHSDILRWGLENRVISL